MSQVKITAFFTPAKKRSAEDDEVTCLNSPKRPCSTVKMSPASNTTTNHKTKEPDDDEDYDEPVLHIRTPARRKRILESSDSEESEQDVIAQHAPKANGTPSRTDSNNLNNIITTATPKVGATSPKASLESPISKSKDERNCRSTHAPPFHTPLQDRINKFRANSSDSPFTPHLDAYATKFRDTPTSTPKFKSHPNKLHFDSPASTKGNISSVIDVKLDGRDADDLPHLKYDFLKENNIRDINRRPKSHPDYDPRTLFVPADFLNAQTPALRQWWLIKQKNMDAILFFKMGKFYEFFNQDAVVAVNELDIIYMKSEEDKPAHAGFPEISFQKYANTLINKGYKVIRIEQTETPEMADERCRRTGQKSKFDRVVAREVCRITTKGTQMMGVMQSIFHTANNQYLLALAESNKYQSSAREVTIGVCFIDVTIGRMYIGQFEDDRTRSNLHLLLAHRTPVEILVERNKLSELTEKALTRTRAQIVQLRSSSEFWDQKLLMTYLRKNDIYEDESGNFQYPKFMRDMFIGGEAAESLVSAEPKPEFSVALRSLGACVYYLDSHMIAHQVLGSSMFEMYVPPLNRIMTESSKENSQNPTQPNLMILDHVALRNLEVFENSAGGSTATLFEAVDKCSTHFGRRLLKEWMSSPLCDLKQINARLDVVDALLANENSSLLNQISELLKQTPDLERLLSKIKSESVSSGNETRAIMFDSVLYSKAKIKSFLDLLSNFRRINNFIQDISQNVPSTSTVLKKLLTFDHDGGSLPDLNETLNFFDRAFDHRKAKETGKIIPGGGVDADYDEAIERIRNIESELDGYLSEQRRKFRCDKLDYFGSGKNRFQLQIPESLCKNLSNDYELETTRKGFKRYYTSAIKGYSEQMTKAEAARDRALDSIMKSLFGRFCKKYKQWSNTIQCLAVLDVLVSFAFFTRSMQASNVDVCRPKLSTKDSRGIILTYSDGRHPALVKRHSDFTPNDMELEQKLILLTGANMGGKSTLMRQTGLLVILAQMGCYVPASSLELSPVDRIFSRLGASDQILEGESTFYTELIETSDVLRHATKDSLVLLDELGRGTATYDGTAIAYSVVREISHNIQCRCLFSTHYHSLVEEFKLDEAVKMAHMACKVERQDENGDDIGKMSEESITFLYRLATGSCPKSYGFNVAKLAGLDSKLVGQAYEKAKQTEFEFNIFKQIQRLTQIDGSLDQLDEDVICNKVLQSLAI